MFRYLPILLTLACGPKAPSVDALQQTPSIPSPRAAAYASVPSTPTDSVVASYARGHSWNESLSGTAAGLALKWCNGQGDLSAWEVREAAWQAGWPYPVLEVRGWITGQGDPPPAELGQWLETIPTSQALGLVRVRGAKGDAWVGLRAEPRRSIPIQPRQVDIGGQLAFEPMPGVEITVSDPAGNVTTVALDTERLYHADVAGEWLFELREPQGLIALFPVYAGMVPPETTVLTERGRPISADDAEKAFRQVLTEVREIYGLKPLDSDPLIQSAARSTLKGNAGDSTAEVARNLGYDPASTWRVTCTARTISDCADKLLWNPRARPALLAPQAHLGLAAELVADGVHVVVLVAAH